MRGPCLNCKDRHSCCQDNCQKPEYIEWRNRLNVISENKNKINDYYGYLRDTIWSYKLRRTL